MSEPYVPSGKEYDEGLPRRAPRTRMGRAISKVTRRRRGPSRVHELRTHVSDEVGEGRKSELKKGRRREVLHERGSTVAVPVAGTDKATAPELQDEVSGDTPARSASTSESVVRARKAAAPRLDAKTRRDLLLVVCASGDLKRQPVVDLLRNAALDPSLGAAARESVGFLVSLADGSDSWVASALPVEVGAVLTYALRVGLEDYRELLQRRARADAALRELQAGQNAYPVLGRIAQLCRSGEATQARVRTMVGDWNAPVYRAHQHAIQAAIEVCADVSPVMMRAPVLGPAAVRVPRVEEQDVVYACLSRLSTSPVHERVATQARSDLSAQASGNPALREYAKKLGIRLQPEQASQSGRKRMSVQAGSPAAAPAARASRPTSTGPKCRKCGVLPAERHGMCSGCSSYGD